MIGKVTLLRTVKFQVLLICVFFGFNILQAQYVAIPDSGFNAWLSANYSTCMHNGKLDTTCSPVLTATYLNTSYQHISSLEGAQYFKSLDSLKCNSDSTLTYIPALAKSLQVLECRNDSLTSLPALPDSLTRLACEFNVLASLPTLPTSLRSLTCYSNKLTGLPSPLPAGLYSLFCSGNQLDSLPALPDSLIILSCYGNKITHLPVLDNSLIDLICSNNLLSSLPALPSYLRNLTCYSNNLAGLPSLPDSLQSLSCAHNRLTTISNFPNSLTLINCAYNKLTGLPSLPDSVFQLFLSHNPALHCLPQLNTIVDFEFDSTSIVCLPNTGNIYLSNPDTLFLCDSTNNRYGCLQISAVKEIAKPSFTLYPNPTKNFFMLMVDQTTIGGSMRIIDNTGRQVCSTGLQMLNTRIETSSLANGLYLVLITNSQGRTSVSKLVLE